MKLKEYSDKVIEELERLQFDKLVNLVVSSGHVQEHDMFLILAYMIERGYHGEYLSPEDIASACNSALKNVIAEKSAREMKQ